LSLPTTLVGLGTVAAIVLMTRFTPKLPAMLIAMIGATLIAWMFKLPVETIGARFGELPRMLPARICRISLLLKRESWPDQP
jgi:SulP family sulfate permease